jgi:hypothetical protein
VERGEARSPGSRRPGGRIALASWTAAGGIGRAQGDGAVPAGTAPSSSFDWGDEACVRELLGDSFELEERLSTLRVPSAEDYRQLFSTSYGATKTLAESLGDRREELRRDWVDFFETNYGDNGEIAHRRQYLLVLGSRR